MRQEKLKSLYVQHVRVSWGKEQRGGIGDGARKSISKVYRMERMPVPTAYHAWSAEYFRRYAAHEGHDVCVQEKAYDAIPGELIRLKDGVLHLLPQPGSVRVSWHDPALQPMEEITVLQEGRWIQLSYQAWGIHRQFYSLHIYNIFFGYPHQIHPDIFLEQQPDAVLEKGTYYSRYLL